MEFLDFDDDMTEETMADTGVDIAASEQAISQFLGALGERPEREGLKNTPRRVARMYTELLGGYRADPQKIVNSPTRGWSSRSR